MSRYLAILEHSPDNCPSSNSSVRAEAMKLPSKLPAALQKNNVKIISDNVLGPAHKIVIVLEGPNIEAVKELIEETGLIQWNSSMVYPSQTIEEAMKSPIMTQPTIF